MVSGITKIEVSGWMHPPVASPSKFTSSDMLAISNTYPIFISFKSTFTVSLGFSESRVESDGGCKTY